jgi:1-deoxy-D-xylulose-5-phosphate synthase
MGIPDYFIEHGSVDELLEEIGLTTETAIKKIKMITPKKEKRA